MEDDKEWDGMKEKVLCFQEGHILKDTFLKDAFRIQNFIIYFNFLLNGILVGMRERDSVFVFVCMCVC